MLNPPRRSDAARLAALLALLLLLAMISLARGRQDSKTVLPVSAPSRAFGRACLGWWPVRLSVRSTPPGGIVRVDDEPVGLSPLSQLRFCGGARIEVRVERPGYEIWQWTGICPCGGQLPLAAELLALEARSDDSHN